MVESAALPVSPDERRYSEDEVREIFEMAADRQQQESASARRTSGLTLSEIQEIGLEVGLEPTALARAAETVAVRTPPRPLRRSLGLPLEVAREVPLPRAPTDEEWGIIVSELRTTFGARGKVSAEAGLREWSNGNLHAVIERAEAGYRLRIGTFRQQAEMMTRFGIVGLATGAIATGAMLLQGGGVDALFAPVMIGAAGTAALLSNFLRVPAWASRRAEQMEYIAAKVASILRS